MHSNLLTDKPGPTRSDAPVPHMLDCSAAPELVLLVDDSAVQRRLIGDAVEQLGYRVVCAVDGIDALNKLQRVMPDVVLLDVTMPNLDGWATLEHIRRISNVPVVMLSASTQVAERKRGLRAGADDYLSKPFQQAELDVRIEAVLRRARENRPDNLTGLPTRGAFEQHIRSLPADTRQGSTLMLMEIDGLDGVNEVLGWEAGNQVVRDIGRIALAHAELDEEVYRIAGDTFAMLVDRETGDAQRLVGLITASIAGHRHLPTISTGLAGVPEHARTNDGLWQRADEALRVARSGGPGHTVVAPAPETNTLDRWHA